MEVSINCGGPVLGSLYEGLVWVRIWCPFFWETPPVVSEQGVAEIWPTIIHDYYDCRALET